MKKLVLLPLMAALMTANCGQITGKKKKKSNDAGETPVELGVPQQDTPVQIPDDKVDMPTDKVDVPPLPSPVETPVLLKTLVGQLNLCAVAPCAPRQLVLQTLTRPIALQPRDEEVVQLINNFLMQPPFAMPLVKVEGQFLPANGGAPVFEVWNIVPTEVFERTGLSCNDPQGFISKAVLNIGPTGFVVTVFAANGDQFGPLQVNALSTEESIIYTGESAELVLEVQRPGNIPAPTLLAGLIFNESQQQMSCILAPF